MRKIIIGVIIIIILVGGVWVWDNLGYWYADCENGIYYKYPKGIVDANWTYSDKNGNKLATCNFGYEGVCIEINKQAGTCVRREVFGF